jgi:hypothetical protein
MTEGLESGATYRIPHYLLFVYVSGGGLTTIGLAMLVFGQRPGFPAWIFLAIVVPYIAFSLYMQQWNPHRVVVSPEGLQMTWTLGVRDVPWDQVAAIELPPHRFKPGHVAQVTMRLKNHRKYTLQAGFANFDDLVRRIRELRPDLIREEAA